MKSGNLLVDLKYATRVTVKDGYILVKLVDSEEPVRLGYSGEWSPAMLAYVIGWKKNEDGVYFDIMDGGDVDGDSGEAGC